MKEDLKKIIDHYGVMPQLKYFQSEVFELNEAVFIAESSRLIGVTRELSTSSISHVAEEIADVMVMLKQFKYCYGISDLNVEEIMKEKIERQLGRIENENSK